LVFGRDGPVDRLRDLTGDDIIERCPIIGELMFLAGRFSIRSSRIGGKTEDKAIIDKT